MIINFHFHHVHCTCNLGKGTILFFDFITEFSKFMASLVEHVSAWYIFVEFQEF